MVDIKRHILDQLNQAVSSLGMEVPSLKLDQSRRPELGDFSSGVALSLTKEAKKPPIELAEAIRNCLDLKKEICSEITVSKPGFLNFRISPEYLKQQLEVIFNEGAEFGKIQLGKGKKAQVEFVSANPTGPLTVGHGRQAVLGDVVAQILEWHGYNVDREYYYNDAGRQMRLLGESVKARYLELLGVEIDFPEGGYEGEYIRDIAREIDEKEDGAITKKSGVSEFRKFAEKMIFSEIKRSLELLHIHFNHFVNEQRFYDDGSIDKVVKLLRQNHLAYDKDGAVWLKTTAFGKEEDTVLIKRTSEPTYRLPDIAYHRDKLSRGYDLIVDIFGADHIDTYPDVLSALNALGYETSSIHVLIHQFVSLIRDGQKVKMSTRKATFITLDELIEMLGADVVRYFFIMRSRQSHLNFDIGLAEMESDENPVYYLQYAHARICNILKHAKDTGIDSSDAADLSLIQEETELSLMKTLIRWPEVMTNVHESLEPQMIANYLQALATEFHRFYTEHRVVTENRELSSARLFLVSSVKTILASGLAVLGISQPEKM
ncbi:MAG: arginine--tRNA ligase [Candidatus Marinimicrobia bacterium]|nr:arginine--tRNA ligase [Candidatus Neomarinimicrobiota bacterium]